MELGSNESVKRAVLAGLGVGMLSRYAIELECATAYLRALDVAAFDCRRMLYIARHRSKPLTRAQAAFVELARSVAGGAGPSREQTATLKAEPERNTGC